jgi:hypothetical protein
VRSWSTQVHYGQEVGASSVGWHADAPNSFLHLALSLRGTRALHSQLAAEADTPRASTDAATAAVHWLPQGCAYLSSPWAFVHGVQYPACSFEDRVVAVQCRFLLTDAALMKASAAYEVVFVAGAWCLPATLCSH